VEVVELSEELKEGALTEWVGKTGLVSNSREALGEMFNPSVGNPGGDQIALVQDHDNMFVGAVSLEMFFDVVASSTKRISSIKDDTQDIRRIDNFIEFFPNSSRLASVKHFVLIRVSFDHVTFVEILVVFVLVSGLSLFNTVNHAIEAVGSKLGLLSSRLGSEGVFEAFDFQEVDLVFFGVVSNEGEGQELLFDQDVVGVFLLQGKISSHFFDLSRIKSSDVTKEFSIGFDSSRSNRSFLHLFIIGLLVVHVQDIDLGFGSVETFRSFLDLSVRIQAIA